MKPMSITDFSKIIKRLNKSNSYEGIADYCGVSVITIKRIEDKTTKRVEFNLGSLLIEMVDI